MPLLYSFRRCPYAIRARLALLISNTECVVREVKLSAKPPGLLAASTKATVPVLVLPDGRVIDESLDIMRWALARHDPEDWLSGDDEALISAFDGAFKPQLDGYKYGAEPLAHRNAAVDMLGMLETRLANRANLGRDTAALTDIAIMPFIRQFAAVEPAWFAAQPLPRLRYWLASHVRSPLFASAMRKTIPWHAGEAAVLLAG